MEFSERTFQGNAEEEVVTMDEIRRLQEELERAQSSGSISRLSERNCVQVVMKLMELKKIELLYTADGKEYLTPKHLEREIRDELYVHRGRINVVDLQTILNVDLFYIDARVAQMLKDDGNLFLIQGELIDKSALDSMAEEVNEVLQESGIISTSELCKRFNLPPEFLLNQLIQRVGMERGKIVKGVMDAAAGTIVTQGFLNRQEARVRGVFSAITRPTALVTVAAEFGLDAVAVENIVKSLIKSGRLAGSISGKSIYTPEIQHKTQQRFITSFFNENGYVEYDTVRRLGVGDAKSYLAGLFHNQGVALDSLYVASHRHDAIIEEITEALNSGSWIDVLPLIPGGGNVADAGKILSKFAAPSRSSSQSSSANRPPVIFCDTIATSQSFIDSLMAELRNFMPQRATEVQQQQQSKGLSQQPSKEKEKERGRSLTQQPSEQDEDDDWGTKKGGKKDKKKTAGKKKEKGNQGGEEEGDISSSDPSVIPFMSLEDMREFVKEKYPETRENSDFVDSLCEYMQKPLTREFQEVVRSVFLSSAEGKDKRKEMEDLQEQFSTIYNNVKQFEKAIEKFSTDDTKTNLTKHLLKTLGNDLVTILFQIQANEVQAELDPSTLLTPEARESKALKVFKGTVKEALTKLNAAISAKTVEEFLSVLDDAAETCQLYIKRTDRKREKQITFAHRHALCEKLKDEQDAAVILHIVSCLLFQKVTNCMIHAPGRVVPHIIKFLEGQIPPEEHAALVAFQKHVIALSKQQQQQQQQQQADGESEASAVEIDRDQIAKDSEALKDLVLKKGVNEALPE